MELEAAKMLGAGLAVIGVIGSGIGIGSIFSSFIVAVGRNPAARGEVFTMTMLGFALVEAIALFALVIALLILRSEEHTSELQSLMRISYAVFCLKKNTWNRTRSNLNTPQNTAYTQ